MLRPRHAVCTIWTWRVRTCVCTCVHESVINYSWLCNSCRRLGIQTVANCTYLFEVDVCLWSYFPRWSIKSSSGIGVRSFISGSGGGGAIKTPSAATQKKKVGIIKSASYESIRSTLTRTYTYTRMSPKFMHKNSLFHTISKQDFVLPTSL